MIKNTLLYYHTKNQYDANLSQINTSLAIAFVEDEGAIYTHGHKFGGSDSGEVLHDLEEIRGDIRDINHDIGEINGSLEDINDVLSFDDVPTYNSKNLLNSGSIYNAINKSASTKNGDSTVKDPQRNGYYWSDPFALNTGDLITITPSGGVTPNLMAFYVYSEGETPTYEATYTGMQSYQADDDNTCFCVGIRRNVDFLYEIVYGNIKKMVDSSAVSYKTNLSLTDELKTIARSNIDAQETLVSEVNIRTINHQSILGEGDLEITPGGVIAQSDWTETDLGDPAYILHKPGVDLTPTSGSNNLVTSNGIYNAVNYSIEEGEISDVSNYEHANGYYWCTDKVFNLNQGDFVIVSPQHVSVSGTAWTYDPMALTPEIVGEFEFISEYDNQRITVGFLNADQFTYSIYRKKNFDAPKLSDWNVNDTQDAAYIKHKPNIINYSVRDSNDLITSGGVYSTINDLLKTTTGHVGLESTLKDGYYWSKTVHRLDTDDVITVSPQTSTQNLIAWATDPTSPSPVATGSFTFKALLDNTFVIVGFELADSYDYTIIKKNNIFNSAVSYVTEQSLTNSQQSTARQNIGLDDDVLNLDPDSNRIYIKKHTIEGKNVITLNDFNIESDVAGSRGAENNEGESPVIGSAGKIFVIQYNFDLNGGTVRIPAGCILEFDGGSITTSVANGTLIGDNTSIIAPMTKIFDTSVKFDGRWTVNEVHPEWFGAITDDQNSNCSPAIQAAIDFAESSYGNTVKFVQGVYWFTLIRPKFKTSLKGSGIGCSILRLVLNADCHAIYIDNHYSCIKLEDFTLVGTAPTLDQRSGVVVPNERYSGIHLADVSEWNNGYPYYSYTEIKGAQNKDVAYKFCYINNIVVARAGNGLYIGDKQYCVFVENSYFRENLGNGVIVKNTDSTINNCYCEYNGLTGFDLLGSNNKITQIKSIFNGFGKVKDSAGISIGGRRNQITDCETQDNFCKGYFIWGQDNNIINCISNTDGYGNINILEVTPENYHYDASLLPYGFLFESTNLYTFRNNISNCKVTYYKDGFLGIYRAPFNLPNESTLVDKSILFDNISVPAIPGRSLFRTLSYCTENGYNSHNLIGDYTFEQSFHMISTEDAVYIDTAKDNISFTNGTTVYMSFKIKDITDIPEVLYKEFIKFISGNSTLAAVGCDFDELDTSEHRLYFTSRRANKSVRGASIKNSDYDTQDARAIITLAIYFYNNYVTVSGYYPRTDKDGIIEYAFFRATDFIATGENPITSIEITNKVLLDKLIICSDSISDTYLIPGAPMGKFKKASSLYIVGSNTVSLDNNKGTSSERPVLKNTNIGYSFFDTDTKKLSFWDGKMWINSDGSIVTNQEDEMVFRMNSTDGDTDNLRRLRITSTSSIRVVIPSDKSATVNNAEKGNDFLLGTGQHTIIFPVGSYNISVYGSRYISRLDVYEKICLIDVAAIANTPSNFTYVNWSNIAGFAERGSLDALMIRADRSIIFRPWLDFTGLSGSIEALKKFNNLSEDSGIVLTLGSSSITGNIGVFSELSDAFKARLYGINTSSANASGTTCLYGNIEAFADYTYIRTFNLGGIPLTGSLVTGLSKSINLTSINVSGHTEAEDLTALFDAIHDGGRSNTSITLTDVGSNKTVTYNGNTISIANGSKITFRADGWDYSAS